MERQQTDSAGQQWLNFSRCDSLSHSTPVVYYGLADSANCLKEKVEKRKTALSTGFLRAKIVH
jgi:hypothetical protein